MLKHLPDDTFANRDIASEADDVSVCAHGILQYEDRKNESCVFILPRLITPMP